METDSSSSADDIDCNPKPKKRARHLCLVCRKKVYDRRSLIRHLRTIHCIEPNVKKPNLKCSFSEDCTFMCASCEVLREHLKTAHNFKVQKRVMMFQNREEFEKWKTEEENQTNARYVAYTGSKCRGSRKLLYLKCHRSGAVRTENVGRKRSRPGRGYTHCGAICPSTIKVSETTSDTIQVVYYPDHLGHSLDDESLRYMKLSSKEKQEILGKLAHGEPVGKIVTDARKKKGGKLSRLNLLERRDVYNLKKKVFYLEKDEEHDAKMIDAWVKGLDLENYKKNPIAHYSPLDKYKDYSLIIIHEVQKIVFTLAFDSAIIYVKTKKGKPNIDFHLTTVSIVCGNGDGYPIAFCISYKAEYATLYTFFQTVHRKFGTIKPQFFVSDNVSQYYMAWKNVMGECENKLVCIFDMESYWGQKLTQLKVPVKKQKDAAARLKSLLYERDKESFEEQLETMMNDWETDSDMKLFLGFFQRQYLRKRAQWATCYRIPNPGQEPIDCNLEPINGALDTIYVESYTGIKNSLNYLMSYIRDICLVRLIKWDERYHQQKNRQTEEKHEEGVRVKGVRTNGTDWFFAEHNFDFVVKKTVSDCDKKCGIFCKPCNVCAHEYSCICKDYVFGFNICKHIHAARIAMTRGTTTVKKDRLEKRKKDRKEFAMIGFKRTAVNIAKSIVSELEDSNLSEEEYKNIAEALTSVQKNLAKDKASHTTSDVTV